MQTPGDNEYYLRRGFDRFYAVGGTLFLDERCSVSTDAPTANWLIYGHNMHDGSMFGQLVRYRDEDFYKAHPTFTFDTPSWTGSTASGPLPKRHCMTPASCRSTVRSC